MARIDFQQKKTFQLALCVIVLMVIRSDCCVYRKSWSCFMPNIFSFDGQDVNDSSVTAIPNELNSKSGSVSVNLIQALHTVDARFLSIAIGSGLIQEGWRAFDFNIPGVVLINITQVLRTVDARFLSLAIDSHLVKVGWRAFDFNSDKLKNLARALSPAILRMGGTDADFLIFNKTNGRFTNAQRSNSPDESSYKKKDHGVNFTMTEIDWNNINKFSEDVGWNILFDLNMLLRNGTQWDSTNAKALLEYTANKGYHIEGWELGNEPNHINHHSNITVKADQLGRDFVALRKLLDENGFQKSFLVGPDITHPIPSSYDNINSILGQPATNFLRSFLQSCGNSTSATTWHTYSLNGRNATVDNFTDPQIMNGVKKEIEEVQKLIQKYRPYLPKSWLGETAGAYGGGAPGLSNSYAGGFLWFDKLGISAANGVDLVIRQTFYSGSYGLLDKELNPTPVYWLSVIYKQLVGPIVLNTNVSVQDTRGDSRVFRYPTHIRTYAHCTNNQTRLGSTHKNGSITLFVINLQQTNHISLSLSGDIATKAVYQYLLTPHGQNITATTVNLNGEKLMLTESDTIPSIEGKELAQDEPITLPPLSYGFFVVHANASACR